MAVMKRMLRTLGWLLGDLATGAAGLVIDALHAGGRALHCAADRLAGRTGARLTTEDHVELLLFELRRDGGAW